MLVHQYARKPLLLIGALFLVAASSAADERASIAGDVDASMDTLVTVEWLSQHLDDPDLVVLDCTVVVEQMEDGSFQSMSGKDNYDAGHIPSAGFADLTTDLADPDNPLPFSMPTPEQFSEVMGALGVGNDSRVVLYAANYPDWAARVWWMLKWAGFDRVALLDGGLQAWTTNGQPLSTEPANRPEKQFTVTPRPDVIADRDQVFAATDDSNISIVDTLPDAHFRGEFALYDRPGHILGATNLPSSDLLDETGNYRSFDEIETMYDSFDRNSQVITYCGGGIAASSVAFNMHRLGFKNVAVYIGSLQEWAADPANPMTLSTP